MVARRSIRPAVAALAFGALGLVGCGVSADAQKTATAGQGSGDVSVDAPVGPGTPTEPFSATGGAVFLRQAAQTTSEVRSASFTMTMDMDMTGGTGAGSMSIVTEGAMDYESGRSRFSMDMGNVFDMEGMDGTEGFDLSGMAQMELITDGDDIYMRSGLFEMFGATWVRTDADDDMATGGPMSNNSPTGMLEFLQGASDDYEVVGTEEVRGVSTTHVRATLDLVSLMEEASPAERERMESELNELGTMGEEFRRIPAEAWVDDDGLVRRFTMSFDLSNEGGSTELGAMGVVVTVEMFDFNQPVDITLPDPSEVTDADDLGLGFEPGS